VAHEQCLSVPDGQWYATMAPMTDAESLPADEAQPLAIAAPNEHDRPLGARVVRGAKRAAVGIVTLVAVYLVVRYLLSEWWVTWVSDRVHNGHGRGLRWGFALGFVPTLLVVAFLRLAVMRAMPAAGRIAFLLLAAGSALPLLLTLAVRAGRHGSGVPSRQIRLLEDHAPWFVSAQLVGTISGLVIGLAVVALRIRRRRRHAHVAPPPAAVSG
jgi:hypothetical protein